MTNNGEITLACADGTDRDCSGPRSFNTGLVNLTGDQVDQIRMEEGQTHIKVTLKQLHDSAFDTNHPNVTSEKEDGVNNYYFDVDFDTTCGACGSDQ